MRSLKGLFPIYLSAIVLSSYASASGFDVSKYEKKFEELYQMGAKKCSPAELARAEIYFDILKSNYSNTEQKDGFIRLKPSSVESVSYPKNLDFYLSMVEKNLYSDKDGDGIPCYKEVELGLNPDVYDRLEPSEKPKQDVVLVDKAVDNITKQVGSTGENVEPLNQPIRVHFYLNRADIRKEYLPYLNVVAKFMKTHPSVKVKIVGYTDDIGSKGYNDKLAIKRATTVKNYLVKQGVDPSRIVIDGVGKDRYLVANDNSVDRFTNRRAEFYVIRLAE